MDREIFKPIKGFETRYSVSNHGRVYSHSRGIYLKGKYDKDGYIEYSLWDGFRPNYRRGHRLVAESFIPNPDNLPVVNHKDHSKDNNHYSNLEWCTVAYNTKYYYSEDKMLSEGKRVLSSLSNKEILHMIEMYKCGKTYKQIVEHFELDIRQDRIGEVLSGRKFSEITGIVEDIRAPDHSNKIKDSTIMDILSDYYVEKCSRQEIKNRYGMTDKWMSLVFSGKRAKRVLQSFSDKHGLSMEDIKLWRDYV